MSLPFLLTLPFVLSLFLSNSVLRSVPYNADAASVDAVDLGSDKPI